MTTKQAGIEGFYWFIAKVESLQDTAMLGRVGIRVLHAHDDMASIQMKDLLWATPLLPNTTSGQKGTSLMHGLDIGSHVVGFYADGHEQQIPMLLGTWAGVGDLPPEAMGVNSVIKKPIGFEKPTAFAARYPFNRVTKTAAGHMMEWDDTPGAERIHFFHKIGTYSEWDAFGNRVDGTPLNFNHSVGGIRNDYTTLIHNITTLGATNLLAGGSITAAAGGSVNMSAGASASMIAGINASVQAAAFASINGGAGVKVVGGFTKIPGVDPTATSPVTIDGTRITSTAATITSKAKAGTQQTQLVDGAYTYMAYNLDADNCAYLDATKALFSVNQATKLELLQSGIAYLSASSTIITGSTASSLSSPLSTTVSASTTETMLQTPAGTTVSSTSYVLSSLNNVSLSALGNMTVQSTDTTTLLSTAGDVVIGAATDVGVTGATMTGVITGLASLLGGSVEINTSTGGTIGIGDNNAATTVSIGGAAIEMGTGSTVTIDISATGIVTITGASGIVLDGNVEVQGNLNTTGILSEAGMQVLTS